MEPTVPASREESPGGDKFSWLCRVFDPSHVVTAMRPTAFVPVLVIDPLVRVFIGRRQGTRCVLKEIGTLCACQCVDQCDI